MKLKRETTFAKFVLSLLVMVCAVTNMGKLSCFNTNKQFKLLNYEKILQKDEFNLSIQEIKTLCYMQTYGNKIYRME